jgi:hypothetical protein
VVRSQEFYHAGTAKNLHFDDISVQIEKAFRRIYTSGNLEGTEDDLAEIPKVLGSLNEQWQESTKQGVLFSQRFKKFIEGNAKVKGQGQVPRPELCSEALPPPSPAKAPPQGAVEGIGTGDDQVAAAAGRAGSHGGCGGGGKAAEGTAQDLLKDA